MINIQGIFLFYCKTVFLYYKQIKSTDFIDFEGPRVCRRITWNVIFPRTGGRVANSRDSELGRGEQIGRNEWGQPFNTNSGAVFPKGFFPKSKADEE